MWRHKGFVNPYGSEWFTSACQHQYNLGSAYEQGYNDAIEALLKYLEDNKMVTSPILDNLRQA